MDRQVLAALSAAILAACAVACDKQTEPIPIPSPIAKPTVTESFSGNIQIGGSFQYQFKVTADSEVHITLVSEKTIAVDADPAADPPVVAKPSVPVNYPLSIQVGTTTISTIGIACTNLKQVTTTAGGTPQLTGQALAGTYCVDISDPESTLPEGVTINVTIAHS